MLRRILLAASLLIGVVAPAFAQAPPAVPALPDTERRTAYAISASTCACSVGFAIYQDGTDVDAWIQVWVNGTRYLSSNGSFGWSLSSATGPLGSIPRPITDAVLTFNAAQTGTVQIVGAQRPRRLIQFPENRGVGARDLNQAFTGLVAGQRELWDKTNDVTGRTLLSQPGVTLGPLPPPNSCVGAFLSFDQTGANPLCSALLPSGSMSTPNSSTVAHVATWGNTTGNKLNDPGLLTSSNYNAVIFGGNVGVIGTLYSSTPMFIGGTLSNPTASEFILEIDAIGSNTVNNTGTFRGPLMVKTQNFDVDYAKSTNSITVYADQGPSVTTGHVEGIVAYANADAGGSNNSDATIQALEVGVGPIVNSNNAHCDQVNNCHTAIWVGNDSTNNTPGSWMFDTGASGGGYNNGISLRLLQTAAGACGTVTGVSGNGGCAWQASNQSAVVTSYISNSGQSYFAIGETVGGLIANLNTVTAGQVGFAGETAVVANCGSLASSTGCWKINVAGTVRYIPFY